MARGNRSHTRLGDTDYDTALSVWGDCKSSSTCELQREIGLQEIRCWRFQHTSLLCLGGSCCHVCGFCCHVWLYFTVTSGRILLSSLGVFFCHVSVCFAMSGCKTGWVGVFCFHVLFHFAVMCVCVFYCIFNNNNKIPATIPDNLSVIT